MTAALPREAIGNGQVWMQISGARVIDLSRQAPGEHLGRLRAALESGVWAEPDLRRAEFYDAVVRGYRYCFYVAPAAGGRPARVFLLATMR
jgi:hypothetical protein